MARECTSLAAFALLCGTLACCNGAIRASKVGLAACLAARLSLNFASTVLVVTSTSMPVLFLVCHAVHLACALAVLFSKQQISKALAPASVLWRAAAVSLSVTYMLVSSSDLSVLLFAASVALCSGGAPGLQQLPLHPCSDARVHPRRILALHGSLVVLYVLQRWLLAAPKGAGLVASFLADFGLALHAVVLQDGVLWQSPLDGAAESADAPLAHLDPLTHLLTKSIKSQGDLGAAAAAGKLRGRTKQIATKVHQVVEASQSRSIVASSCVEDVVAHLQPLIAPTRFVVAGSRDALVHANADELTELTLLLAASVSSRRARGERVYIAAKAAAPAGASIEIDVIRRGAGQPVDRQRQTTYAPSASGNRALAASSAALKSGSLHDASGAITKVPKWLQYAAACAEQQGGYLSIWYVKRRGDAEGSYAIDDVEAATLHLPSAGALEGAASVRKSTLRWWTSTADQIDGPPLRSIAAVCAAGDEDALRRVVQEAAPQCSITFCRSAVELTANPSSAPLAALLLEHKDEARFRSDCRALRAHAMTASVPLVAWSRSAMSQHLDAAARRAGAQHVVFDLLSARQQHNGAGTAATQLRSALLSALSSDATLPQAQATTPWVTHAPSGSPSIAAALAVRLSFSEYDAAPVPAMVAAIEGVLRAVHAVTTAARCKLSIGTTGTIHVTPDPRHATPRPAGVAGSEDVAESLLRIGLAALTATELAAERSGISVAATCGVGVLPEGTGPAAELNAQAPSAAEQRSSVSARVGDEAATRMAVVLLGSAPPHCIHAVQSPSVTRFLTSQQQDQQGRHGGVCCKSLGSYAGQPSVGLFAREERAPASWKAVATEAASVEVQHSGYEAAFAQGISQTSLALLCHAAPRLVHRVQAACSAPANGSQDGSSTIQALRGEVQELEGAIEAKNSLLKNVLEGVRGRTEEFRAKSDAMHQRFADLKAHLAREVQLREAVSKRFDDASTTFLASLNAVLQRARAYGIPGLPDVVAIPGAPEASHLPQQYANKQQGDPDRADSPREAIKAFLHTVSGAPAAPWRIRLAESESEAHVSTVPTAAKGLTFSHSQSELYGAGSHGNGQHDDGGHRSSSEHQRSMRQRLDAYYLNTGPQSFSSSVHRRSSNASLFLPSLPSLPFGSSVESSSTPLGELRARGSTKKRTASIGAIWDVLSDLLDGSEELVEGPNGAGLSLEQMLDMDDDFWRGLGVQDSDIGLLRDLIVDQALRQSSAPMSGASNCIAR